MLSFKLSFSLSSFTFINRLFGRECLSLNNLSKGAPHPNPALLHLPEMLHNQLLALTWQEISQPPAKALNCFPLCSLRSGRYIPMSTKATASHALSCAPHCVNYSKILLDLYKTCPITVMNWQSGCQSTFLTHQPKLLTPPSPPHTPNWTILPLFMPHRPDYTLKISKVNNLGYNLELFLLAFHCDGKGENSSV